MPRATESNSRTASGSRLPWPQWLRAHERTVSRKARFQAAVFVPIVPAVELERLGLFQGAEPRRQGLLVALQPCRNRVRIGILEAALDAVGDEGRQHAVAHVVQREVHRVAPVVGEGRLGAARGHRDHGAATGEVAFVVTHAAGVEPAVDQDPVEPALEDGRHGVPPHGVLEEQEVGALELVDLGPDLGAGGALLPGVALFRLGAEPVRILHVREVFRTLDRIETQGVEVGNLDSVAGIFQGFDRHVLELCVEGLGLGMGEHDQRPHYPVLPHRMSRAPLTASFAAPMLAPCCSPG
jgi:hypothetical protein